MPYFIRERMWEASSNCWGKRDYRQFRGSRKARMARATKKTRKRSTIPLFISSSRSWPMASWSLRRTRTSPSSSSSATSDARGSSKPWWSSPKTAVSATRRAKKWFKFIGISYQVTTKTPPNRKARMTSKTTPILLRNWKSRTPLSSTH